MAKGGRREGAGRPAGSKSRATLAAKATLSELAQGHTESALATLAEIMADATQTGSARIAAATALLDRGYGRPRQTTELTGPDGGPLTEAPTLDASRLSDAALAEIMAAMDERAQGEN
ncbi:hypothetical protein [Paracoccus sp. (in: a-proteobacteria)]|uniref:hypothetical protein n=1 Tax=Paracoccus sp. TaxID=267 RepID=UPI00322036B4